MKRANTNEKAVEIGLAVDGRTLVTTPSLARFLRMSVLLSFRYGFKRKGTWIPAITDQAIYPDFVRGDQRILAGWDNYIRYSLHAENAETDAFLSEFYMKHCS